MSAPNEKLKVLRRIPEIRFDEELRGYNKHQVDRVLENLAPLADEVDTLVERLGEAERRAAAAEARVMESGGPAPTPDTVPAPAPVPEPPVAPAPAPVAAENFDETLSKTLLLAQRTADATVQEANEEAARIKAEAEAEAAAMRQAAEDETASMRVSAAEERSAAIEQANREVAAMIDTARSTIDAKVAEAEAELAEAHTGTRDQLLEQIGELQRSRDALALDVEHFEGHLSSRRDVIRSAIAELSEVVDDPEKLRTVMPPSPVAEVGDPGPIEDPKVEVTALDTLASAVADDAEAQGVMTPDLSGAPAAPVDAATSEATNSGVESSGVESSGVEGVTWADEGNTWADDEVDQTLSSGLLVDPAPSESDLEATQAIPAVDAADEPASTDPFLDELRRATTEDDGGDEALDKFLAETEDNDDAKGGWFNRRK